MDSAVYSAFVIYYIIAIISILANVITIIYLFVISRGKPWRIFSLLLFYLHFSLTCEELTAIPFIYKGNETLCLIVESLKFYFGLKNLLAVMMLIRVYSMYVLNSTDFYFPVKNLRIIQIVLSVLPAIAFLPFSDGSYSYPSEPWCSLPASGNLLWEIFIQYLWVWILLCITIYSNLRIIQKLYSSFDSLLMHNYLHNVVNYSIVAFLSWIPRTIIRFSHSSSTSDYTAFYAYFPMYISGILYVALFFRNITAVKKYEEMTTVGSGSDVALRSVDWSVFFDTTGSYFTSPFASKTHSKEVHLATKSDANANPLHIQFLKNLDLEKGQTVSTSRTITRDSDRGNIT
jgi:hypothetical protein